MPMHTKLKAINTLCPSCPRLDLDFKIKGVFI